MIENIPLTFDKSHIITIGEKLYSQSIELIRELVNNAYDADATRVDVSVEEDEISVSDNGRGMDIGGLRQYFSVGSQEKMLSPKSERFHRDRIGQFGIGKFASLAAADRFEVKTQRGAFAAKVVFDRNEWEGSDAWTLPLEKIAADRSRGDGTTVTLSRLTRSFEIDDVEECIVSGVPLKAPGFEVFLNGYKMHPRTWSGHKMPVMEGTSFGPVHGEIVILSESGGSFDGMGVECRVKGAAITRETFGIEKWGLSAARVRGELNADFLPITSDRTGFIVDTAEYREFVQAVHRILGEAKKVLGKLSDRRENRRASRALNEALDRVWNSIVRNPDCSPFGAIPIGGEGYAAGGAAALTGGHKEAGQDHQLELGGEVPSQSEKTAVSELPQLPKPEEAELPMRLKKKPQKIKKLTPNSVVKRLKFGKHKIACCLDHFGEDGPECFSEGTVIYINRDHPLYHREMKRAWSYTVYIARLLTQEIALMKESRSAKKAFALQGRMLKGAFESK